MIKIKKIFKILAYCYVFTGLLQSCEKKVPPNGADNPITSTANTSLEITTTSQSAVTNEPVTFSVLLKPSSLLSNNPPTGNMTFYQNGEIISNCNSVPINESLIATCTTQFSSIGTYNISATYVGDQLYNQSKSDIFSFTVQGFRTQTNLTISSDSLTVGHKIVLSATVTVTQGNTVSQGSVKFLVNDTEIPCTVQNTDSVFKCEYQIPDANNKKFKAIFSDNTNLYQTSSSAEELLNNIAKLRIEKDVFEVKWVERDFNIRTVDITLKIKDTAQIMGFAPSGTASFSFKDWDGQTKSINCINNGGNEIVKNSTGDIGATCRFKIPAYPSGHNSITFYAQYNGNAQYEAYPANQSENKWNYDFYLENVGHELRISLKEIPGILFLSPDDCTLQSKLCYRLNYENAEKLKLTIQVAGINDNKSITTIDSTLSTEEYYSRENYLLFKEGETLGNLCSNDNPYKMTKNETTDINEASCDFKPLVKKIFLKFKLKFGTQEAIEDILITVSPPTNRSNPDNASFTLPSLGCGLSGTLHERLFDCSMWVTKSAWGFDKEDHKKELHNRTSFDDQSFSFQYDASSSWFLLACNASATNLDSCAFLSPEISVNSPLNRKFRPYFINKDGNRTEACIDRPYQYPSLKEDPYKINEGEPKEDNETETQGICYFDSKKQSLFNNESNSRRRFIVDAVTLQNITFCAPGNQILNPPCNAVTDIQGNYIEYNVEKIFKIDDKITERLILLRDFDHESLNNALPDDKEVSKLSASNDLPILSAAPAIVLTERTPLGHTCTEKINLVDSDNKKLDWQVPSYPMLYMMTGADKGRFLEETKKIDEIQENGICKSDETLKEILIKDGDRTITKKYCIQSQIKINPDNLEKTPYYVCDRDKKWIDPFCDNTYGFNANAIIYTNNIKFNTSGFLWSSSYAGLKDIKKDNDTSKNILLGWAYRDGYMIGLPVTDKGLLRCMAIVDEKGKNVVDPDTQQ